MKVRMKFKPFQIVVLSLVAAIGVTAVVLNALMLAEVSPFTNAVPAVCVASLCCSAIIFVVVVLVFIGSYYEFREDKMLVRFAFIPDSVAYSDVTALKENTETQKLFLVFKAKNSKREDGLDSLMFLFDPSHFETVQEFLKDKGVLFELFDNKED